MNLFESVLNHSLFPVVCSCLFLNTIIELLTWSVLARFNRASDLIILVTIMLLLLIEQKFNWNLLLPTIESKNLNAIIMVSNSVNILHLRRRLRRPRRSRPTSRRRRRGRRRWGSGAVSGPCPASGPVGRANHRHRHRHHHIHQHPLPPRIQSRKRVPPWTRHSFSKAWQ